MKLNIVISVFIFTRITLTTAQCNPNNQPQSTSFSTAFQWTYIDFVWPTNTSKNASILDGSYVQGNCIMISAKYFNSKFYCSLSKLGYGCPYSLAKFNLNSAQNNTPLIPYPDANTSLDTNIADCTKIQAGPTLEISPIGNLWVIDGKRDGTPNTTVCPVTLYIYSADSGVLSTKYVFPNNFNGSYFNSMVLDPINAYYMYFTDSGINYALYVFGLSNNTLIKISTAVMQFEIPTAPYVTLNGLDCLGNISISNLALTPAFYRNQPERYLYFSVGNGKKLYRMNTMIARNAAISQTTNAPCHINYIGKLTCPTDKMMFDHAFNLYYGDLCNNTVSKWIRFPPDYDEAILSNVITSAWPASYTFNNNGDLYVLVNNKCAFYQNVLNTSNVNFAILSFHTNTCDYQRVRNEMVSP